VIQRDTKRDEVLQDLFVQLVAATLGPAPTLAATLRRRERRIASRPTTRSVVTVTQQ